MTDATTQLTEVERGLLVGFERTVAISLIATAKALVEIKVRQLYREYGTWDDYCQRRWGNSARWADYHIKALPVMQAISDENARSDDPLALPGSEYQVRPLTALPTDEAIDTWRETVTVYGENSTGNQVSRVRNRREQAEATASAGVKNRYYRSASALSVRCAVLGSHSSRSAWHRVN
jgi:hypothetical protein